MPRFIFASNYGKVPLDLAPWPLPGRRRASISSFGFGGTNVHVILESIESYRNDDRQSGLNGSGNKIERTEQIRLTNGHENGIITNGYHAHNGDTAGNCVTKKSSPTYRTNGMSSNVEVGLANDEHETSAQIQRKIFVLTASHKESARAQIESLSNYLKDKKDVDETFFDNLAFTLATRRSMLEWRAAVSASTSKELEEALNVDLAAKVAKASQPSIGFIFTGQGAQWPCMGRELLDYPVFASAMREADEHLQYIGADWSLIGEILNHGSLMFEQLTSK